MPLAIIPIVRGDGRAGWRKSPGRFRAAGFLLLGLGGGNLSRKAASNGNPHNPMRSCARLQRLYFNPARRLKSRYWWRYSISFIAVPMGLALPRKMQVR